MPVDHTSITIPLSKFAAFKAFLLDALEPLGTKVVMDLPQYNSVGLGENRPYYFIFGMEMDSEEEAVALKMLKGQHPGFAAPSEEQVQHFHAAALKAGATDNGPPGPRPQYGQGYYAAFVIDPVLGFNVEAVYRRS